MVLAGLYLNLVYAGLRTESISVHRFVSGSVIPSMLVIKSPARLNAISHLFYKYQFVGIKTEPVCFPGKTSNDLGF